jgi:hypothetical protein
VALGCATIDSAENSSISLSAKPMGRGTARSAVEARTAAASPSTRVHPVPLPMRLRLTGRTGCPIA